MEHATSEWEMRMRRATSGYTGHPISQIPRQNAALVSSILDPPRHVYVSSLGILYAERPRVSPFPQAP